MEQQQKAAERQEEQRRSSAAMLPGSSPGVNIPHQHTEIPTSVFKVRLKSNDLIHPNILYYYTFREGMDC